MDTYVIPHCLLCGTTRLRDRKLRLFKDQSKMLQFSSRER
jgi:hypothetical protein